MDAKYATAGNMFRQAGHIFALKHRFQEAGDAFCMESDCRERDGEGKEAAVAWWNAVNAYKRAEPSDCGNLFIIVLPSVCSFDVLLHCSIQLFLKPLIFKHMQAVSNNWYKEKGNYAHCMIRTTVSRP